MNVNYRYTTAEIDYILADSGARALFFQADFAEVVAPLGAALAMTVPIDGPVRAYQAMASGDGAPLAIQRSPDDGYMLYTGGTTGRPKGLMWRSGDIRAIQLQTPMLKMPIATMGRPYPMAAQQCYARPCPARMPVDAWCRAQQLDGGARRWGHGRPAAIAAV